MACAYAAQFVRPVLVAFGIPPQSGECVRESRGRNDREVAADLKKLKEHYNYYQHVDLKADHLSLVTDRVIDSMVIAGTPAEVLPRFRAILDLGVDRIVIPLTVKDRKNMLKTLADEVLAHLT